METEISPDVVNDDIEEDIYQSRRAERRADRTTERITRLIGFVIAAIAICFLAVRLGGVYSQVQQANAAQNYYIGQAQANQRFVNKMIEIEKSLAVQRQDLQAKVASDPRCQIAPLSAKSPIFEQHCEVSPYGGAIVYFRTWVKPNESDASLFGCRYGISGVQLDPMSGLLVVHLNGQRGMTYATISRDVEMAFSDVVALRATVCRGGMN